MTNLEAQMRAYAEAVAREREAKAELKLAEDRHKAAHREMAELREAAWNGFKEAEHEIFTELGIPEPV